MKHFSYSKPTRNPRSAGARPAILVAGLGLLATWPGAEARDIHFSGYEWTVKSSNGRVGPGPNYFSGSRKSVWKNRSGLHLKIRKINGRWHCAEVISKKSLGYGTYTFYLNSRVDKLDRRTVVGLFTYRNDKNEVDIEFSRWNKKRRKTYLQYVVQPYYRYGNMHRKNLQVRMTRTTHRFRWTRKYILFESFKGWSTSQRKRFESWKYTGPDIPNAKRLKTHINFWLYQGKQPSSKRSAELVIKKFRFKKKR